VQFHGPHDTGKRNCIICSPDAAAGCTALAHDAVAYGDIALRQALHVYIHILVNILVNCAGAGQALAAYLEAWLLTAFRSQKRACLCARCAHSGT
jgi:hypothetical protein